MDRDGRGGGVANFWRKSLKCEITSYSLHHINVGVDDAAKARRGITDFYGYADRSRRRESWALLRRLARLSQLPWCTMGDFNDLLSLEDKRGRCYHPYYLMKGFGDAVQDVRLIDIALEGHQYTWRFAFGTERAIEQRLK